MNDFFAHGKLLITGEYAVLDGALALALPTQLGQKLSVQKQSTKELPRLFWEAFLVDNSIWFRAEFDLNKFEIIASNNPKLAQTLQQIFQTIRELNPLFLVDEQLNILAKTQLQFNHNWGLGSSSTLISLLSQWSNVNPFKLSNRTFKTSGYDVACATAKGPIQYQIIDHQNVSTEIDFNPNFKDQLYFVYLNQKQNTQNDVGVSYRSLAKDPDWIDQISQLTLQISNCQNLTEFESLLEIHEDLISNKIKKNKVKELYFKDYQGVVKSLGAWGGDFVLVTNRPGMDKYFKQKGFDTIISYSDMIK